MIQWCLQRSIVRQSLGNPKLELRRYPVECGYDLGDGVAATQNANQASEQFVIGGIRQVFLR